MALPISVKKLFLGHFKDFTDPGKKWFIFRFTLFGKKITEICKDIISKFWSILPILVKNLPDSVKNLPKVIKKLLYSIWPVFYSHDSGYT